MADVRPDLDAVFGPFKVEATVTIPGFAPVVTVWAEQRSVGEGFPADTGRWSLTKSRRRGSLRLDHLPPASQPGLSWPPPGTKIVLEGETLHVEGVDSQDGQVSHVIVR